jgi:hypothetical protein
LPFGLLTVPLTKVKYGSCSEALEGTGLLSVDGCENTGKPISEINAIEVIGMIVVCLIFPGSKCSIVAISMANGFLG